jgi:hypothetical protein
MDKKAKIGRTVRIEVGHAFYAFHAFTGKMVWMERD